MTKIKRNTTAPTRRSPASKTTQGEQSLAPVRTANKISTTILVDYLLPSGHHVPRSLYAEFSVLEKPLMLKALIKSDKPLGSCRLPDLLSLAYELNQGAKDDKFRIDVVTGCLELDRKFLKTEIDTQGMDLLCEQLWQDFLSAELLFEMVRDGVPVSEVLSHHVRFGKK